MSKFPIAFLCFAACAGPGALGQATMVGRCAEGDAACSRRHPLAPIAVGARFYPEVSTDLAGTSTPSLRLESAGTDVVAIDGSALVAKQPGTAAVLISTDDGAVVDFVHIWVAPITEITLARRDGDRVTGTVGMTVGEDLTLQPALWNGAQRLAGDGDIAWSVAGDAALAVMRDGSSDRRRLRARAPGKATITVALGDAKTSLDVEVVP